VNSMYLPACACLRGKLQMAVAVVHPAPDVFKLIVVRSFSKKPIQAYGITQLLSVLEWHNLLHLCLIFLSK
jgi:hypothetical protein